MMCRSETPDAGALRSAARTRTILVCVGCVLALWLEPLGLASEKAPYANTFTVNSLTDAYDGTCSGGDVCNLRAAVYAANATGGTIDFSVTGEIKLERGEIGIGNDIVISGPGANKLTISGNDASSIFGIINGTHVTISGVTIAHGHAIDKGGGVRNWGTLTVNNCIFSENHAEYGGGGITNGEGATLTVSDSTFTGNSTTYTCGAGLYSLEGATLTVSDSTFSGNHATGEYSAGGGICSDGKLTVTGSTFSGNTAVWGGGGMLLYDTANVSNCTFSDNSAVDRGGGIFNQATLTLINNTFLDNSATSGGGIDSFFRPTTATNCIIANSTGGNCTGQFGAASSHNLATDGTCPASFTQTTSGALALGQVTGDPAYFPLNAGSVAIDAGTNDGCPATDQPGNPRPQDGDGNGSAVCDVGSYEAPGVVVEYHRVYLPLVVRNYP